MTIETLFTPSITVVVALNNDQQTVSLSAIQSLYVCMHDVEARATSV